MGMRYSKKDVERRFRFMAAVMGKRVATSSSDVGAWELDYDPSVGGYVIREILTKGHGITHPFGSLRLPATPFVEWTFVLAEGIRLGTEISTEEYDRRIAKAFKEAGE